MISNNFNPSNIFQYLPTIDKNLYPNMFSCNHGEREKGRQRERKSFCVSRINSNITQYTSCYASRNSLLLDVYKNL